MADFDGMGTSLKLFLRDVLRRGWFLIVSIPSTIVGGLGLYLPNSLFEATILDFLPAVGGTVFVTALFWSAFMTYHELRLTLPQSRYDPEVAKIIYKLVASGQDMLARQSMLARPEQWVKAVEAILTRHIPVELRMFQTAGKEHSRGSYVSIVTGKIGRSSKRISPGELAEKVNKLRLIMGRYEKRQQS